MGLALESLVGFYDDGKEVCNVSEGTLRTLLEISNERFQVNTARITRFRQLLVQSMSPARDQKDGVMAKNGKAHRRGRKGKERRD